MNDEYETNTLVHKSTVIWAAAALFPLNLRLIIHTVFLMSQSVFDLGLWGFVPVAAVR